MTGAGVSLVLNIETKRMKWYEVLLLEVKGNLACVRCWNGIAQVVNDLSNPLGQLRRLMLYPTELRAPLRFQSLTRLVLDRAFAECSWRVLLQISVNLLGSLSQVSRPDGSVLLPQPLELMANYSHSGGRVPPALLRFVEKQWRRPSHRGSVWICLDTPMPHPLSKAC